MELTERYILEDGKRLNNAIDVWPEKRDIFRSTPELLKFETIELLCLLREARDYRTEVYQLRILTHKGKEQASQEGSNMGEMQEIDSTSYDEYEKATRKVWIIENIIKDRIGYYPQKVTENFLAMYLERIEKSQKKRMTIRKEVKS